MKLMRYLLVSLVVALMGIMPVTNQSSAAPKNHSQRALKSKQDLHTMADQARFDHRTITIGIDPSTPQYEQQSLAKAVESWNQAGIVTLKIKDYNIHDDILVDNAMIRPQGQSKSFYTLGSTTPTVKNGFIKQSHIEIDEGNVKKDHDNDQELIDQEMTNVMEHEIGHALGLPHVTRYSSCMYPIDNGPVTNYDYGLLDRLYSNKDQAQSQVYGLPMNSGFTIDNEKFK